MKNLILYIFLISFSYFHLAIGGISTTFGAEDPPFEIGVLGGDLPATTNETVVGFTITNSNSWDVDTWFIDNNRCVVTNNQGGTQGASTSGQYLYLVFKNIKLNKTAETITCLAFRKPPLMGNYTAAYTVPRFTLVMPTPTFTSGSSQNVPCYITTVQISLNDYINDGGYSDGLEITDEFEWTLPSGWQTTSSQTGTFVAGKTINVILPTSSSTQNITVRAKAYDQYSSSATLQITRNIGQFSISGNTIVDCRRGYNYATQYYPGITYSWLLPQGWTGSSSNSSISTYAGQAGIISMTATACGQDFTAQLEITKSNIISDNSYISGDDILCSNGAIYGLSSVFNNNPTITWTVSDNIEPPSTTGRYVTLAADGNGTGDIVATISNPSCDTDIRTKSNMWVGEPDPDDFFITANDNYGSPIGPSNGPFQLCSGNYYTFYLFPSYDLPSSHHKYGISDIDFFFDFDYQVVNSGYAWVYIYVNNIDGQSNGVIYVDSECGGYDEFKVVNINEGYCGYSLIITPNPSSGETTLTLQALSKEEPVGMNEEWDLEIFDQQQNLKERFQKVKNNKKVINVSNWKEGIYFLRVKYKETNITGKLVVSKN